MTCTLRGISRTNAASIKTTPMPSPTETPIYTHAAALDGLCSPGRVAHRCFHPVTGMAQVPLKVHLGTANGFAMGS